MKGNNHYKIVTAKTIFLFLLCFLFPISRTFGNSNIDSYLDFYQTYQRILGPLGSAKDGEIEIILDPKKIMEISHLRRDQLIQKGLDKIQAKKYSKIGIVYEDSYWVLIRDAVIFPSGSFGTYNRIFWKSSFESKQHHGVAILAILDEGRIALNVEFRHATRNFELELPRGGAQKNETDEETAKRELKEETGLIAKDLIYLGEMAIDTGILADVAPIYAAKIVGKGSENREESEAILSTLTLSKEELKNALYQGFIELNIGGKNKKIYCRDSFIAFALFQAEMRGLL